VRHNGGMESFGFIPSMVKYNTSERDATERRVEDRRERKKYLLEFIVRYISALLYCGMAERICMG